MSLSELKLLAQLETRQKNVNKKFNNIVQEETQKLDDEPYLTESIDETPINQLQIPTLEEIKNNLSEEQINEIYEYVLNNIMPDKTNEIQRDFDRAGFRDKSLFDDAYRNVLTKEVEKEIDNYARRRLVEVNNLNLGNQKSERLPNETDEQYLDRLESIRLSLPDSQSIIELKKLQERNKLKDKLQKIMKYSDTEAIINNTDLMTDENVALLNRIFPKFNKDIRETFKSIDLQTFKDYTKNYLENFKSKHLNQPNSLSETDSDTIVFKPTAKTPFKFSDVYDNGEEEENDRNRIDHFNLNYSHPTPRGDYSPLLGTQELKLLREAEATPLPNISEAIPLTKSSQKYSEKGRKGDIEHYLTEKYGNVNDIRTKLQIFQSPDSPYYNEFVGVETKKEGKRKGTTKNRSKQELIKSVASKLYNIEENKGETPEEVGWGLKKKRGNNYRKKTFYGKGISPPTTTDENKFYPFGKFLIDNDKLEKNIIRIIYASTGINHPQMKNTLVSDDFKDMIMDIIINFKFNERSYKRLSKDERHYMKTLLEKSGVAKILKIADLDDDEDKAMMNRIRVIQGELEIGNNSPLLKTEAIEIIKHFIANGKINEANGYKMLYTLAN